MADRYPSASVKKEKQTVSVCEHLKIQSTVLLLMVIFPQFFRDIVLCMVVEVVAQTPFFALIYVAVRVGQALNDTQVLIKLAPLFTFSG